MEPAPAESRGADFAVVRRGHEALPYAVRVPVDGTALVFAVAAPWPDDDRLRCHPLEAWPTESEVVDRCRATSVVRRGPCLDIILDRRGRGRCQLLMSPPEPDGDGDGDDEVMFWQTSAVAPEVTPRQRVPTALGRGVEELSIHVDTREQHAWEFEDHPATTESQRLDAGDYAVLHEGTVVAAVERKKTSDFAKGLMRGRMPAQLAALAELPRAVVVVESSYANVLSSRLRITRCRMADLIGSVQAAYPSVPFVFAGSRPSAQEYSFHWLAGCLSHHLDELAPGPLDPTG